MSVSRWSVLEALAAETDPSGERTTTIDALATTLDTDELTVERHLAGLEACDLARQSVSGCVRVTITGEQLLDLDTGQMVILDPENSGRNR